MSYPNAYLRDFVPVLGQILKEKQIAPEKLHLEIIDEESEEKSIFEPVGVDEVLDQLADELNHLTVYTDRPAHFQAFAEQIYEENGLMPLIFTKKQLKSRSFSGVYHPTRISAAVHRTSCFLLLRHFRKNLQSSKRIDEIELKIVKRV